MPNEENDHRLFDEAFEESPESRGAAVPLREISAASAELGVPFGPDYTEFISRYGGALVGAYEIFGLRRAGNMGTDWDNLMEITTHFRKQKWPGTEDWAVFSTDQGGNPIGLSPDGMIWLSDHDNRQIVAMFKSFEQFIRVWCLETDDDPDDYYDERPWPVTE